LENLVDEVHRFILSRWLILTIGFFFSFSHYELRQKS